MAYSISTAFAILLRAVVDCTVPDAAVRRAQPARDGEGAPGTDPGAPIVTHYGRKLIWTTVISAIIFASAMLAFNAGYFNRAAVEADGDSALSAGNGGGRK